MQRHDLPLWVPVAIIGVTLLVVGGIRYANLQMASTLSDIDKKFDALRLRPVTDRDHYRGSLRAPVQVIVFSDPECPYCKYLHMNVLPELRKRYQDNIVIAYRHHLRPQFTRSPREAEATECVALIGGEEKFWRYLDRMYQITPSDNGLDPKELMKTAEYVGVTSRELEQCLEDGRGRARVNTDRHEANTNEIITAPTVVIRADGILPLFLPGSYPGPIRAAIDSVLARTLRE